MKKEDLISYLDEYLNIHEFQDSSKNGLQVDNSKKEIKKIGYGVDASTYIFEKAKKEKVDMMIVHHGMFWGKESVLVGLPYLRAKELILNDIALYACHLPLDAHPVVGNNAGLMQGFIDCYNLKEGTYEIEKFGIYEGQAVGFGIKFEKGIFIEDIISKYTSNMNIENKLYNFGNKKLINSIAFVSGGGLLEAPEAKEKGYDLFITGEGAHYEIQAAKELGQTILLGNHYETEKIGPTLLANHLKEMFGLEIVYIDEKY